MTMLMSKRQQARNERDLQGLIGSVSGNDRCADCQARNPGWASWSLGIFLCMRCAALHRKLGTHISKVKSLSMDTWSSDQVEAMRQNGNTSVNETYNPRNIKPGIPLDVDEVDSAMERFIRQKYQERSLADGKPKPPSHDEISPQIQSPRPTPSADIHPPKKGKIFGFKLRASSSAYPMTKRDSRNLPPLPATPENAFHAEIHSQKPSKPLPSINSDENKAITEKLFALREMGFPDDRRNRAVLKRLSGDIGRTVESLARLGGGSGSNSARSTPIASQAATPLETSFSDTIKRSTEPDLGLSTNPFDRPRRVQTLEVPQAMKAQPASYNTYDPRAESQSSLHSMDQAFQTMQVSQPLFQHGTGGYPRQPPAQDADFPFSATPPVSEMSRPYGYTASPSTTLSANPFLPLSQPQQSGAFAPYSSAQQNAPFSAPATNPFFNQQAHYEATQATPLSAPLQYSSTGTNPFGIPPSPQSAPAQHQQHSFSNNVHLGLSSLHSAQQPIQMPQQAQTPSYPPSQPPFSPSQPPSATYQQPPGPFLPSFSPQPSPQYQSHQESSQLQPQPTGRFDKDSILALYNYPHLSPQPMPTTSNDGASPSKTWPSSTNSPSGPAAPASNSEIDIIKNSIPSAPARRSATMPVSSPLAGGFNSAMGASAGNKNPFLNTRYGNTQANSNNDSPSQHNSRVTSPVPVPTNSIMHHHASQESVSLGNLENGRHSPDVFANLSARFVK